MEAMSCRYASRRHFKPADMQKARLRGVIGLGQYSCPYEN